MIRQPSQLPHNFEMPTKETDNLGLLLQPLPLLQRPTQSMFTIWDKSISYLIYEKSFSDHISDKTISNHEIR